MVIVAYDLNKSKEIENIEWFALVLLCSVVENLYVLTCLIWERCYFSFLNHFYSFTSICFGCDCADVCFTSQLIVTDLHTKRLTIKRTPIGGG